MFIYPRERMRKKILGKNALIVYELLEDSWCPQNYPICYEDDCVIEECANGNGEPGCEAWNKAPDAETPPQKGLQVEGLGRKAPFNYVKGVGRAGSARMCTGNFHKAVNERIRDLKTRAALDKELANALHMSAFQPIKHH
mmetsp:Transcript_87094/g.137455  ORF Transcript_87094/g.137455 Transcript_87094/m.137455 type:complete len:140 (+) Transcript_87094:124-543(+)